MVKDETETRGHVLKEWTAKGYKDVSPFPVSETNFGIWGYRNPDKNKQDPHTKFWMLEAIGCPQSELHRLSANAKGGELQTMCRSYQVTPEWLERGIDYGIIQSMMYHNADVSNEQNPLEYLIVSQPIAVKLALIVGRK